MYKEHSVSDYEQLRTEMNFTKLKIKQIVPELYVYGLHAKRYGLKDLN